MKKTLTIEFKNCPEHSARDLALDAELIHAALLNGGIQDDCLLCAAGETGIAAARQRIKERRQ